MALHLWAGNTITLGGTVRGQNGIILPLDEHAIFTFSVREMINGTPILQKAGAMVGDGSTGQLTVILDPVDTDDLSGPYVFDISMLVHGRFHTLQHKELQVDVPIKQWAP